jgi:hypothetical protein
MIGKSESGGKPIMNAQNILQACRRWAAIASLVAGVASADIIQQDNFNNGSQWTQSTSTGYSIVKTATQAMFSQSAGTGNGSGLLTTVISAAGDFTATVDINAGGLSSNGESGFGFFVPASPTHFSDIFYVGPGQINSNIFNGNPYRVTSNGASSSSALLEIQRVGDTVTTSFNTGGGLFQANSVTGAEEAGPIQITLFLSQEFGNTAASQATFSNFTFSVPPTPTPEPAGWLTMIPSVAAVVLLRRKRKA